MMKHSLIILISILFNLSLFAQDGLDEVYMKNGSVFKGEILSYEQGKSITIKLPNKQVLVLEDADIQRVVEALPEEDISVLPELQPIEKEPAIYKTSGWYNSTFISFAGGGENSDDGSNFKLGSGLHNVIGKQMSRMFGIGLGVGLDNYSRRGETVFPVYLEVRGYPLKNKDQFYYAVSGGWGFTFKRESFGITETEGGYYFHPAIGFRLGTPDATNVNVDLGYKIQDAFFLEQLLNGDVDERNVVFNRITLRVGVTLWK